MLGKATSRLERHPKRFLQRFWGGFDIHARQKWSRVWPILAAYDRSECALLDAGCATGTWVFEIASKRKGWNLTGIDIDPEAIRRAEEMRRVLGSTNIRFEIVDFLSYLPEEKFDVVLSVASAHYLVENGAGERLFRNFATWLGDGGQLILFVPRFESENPVVGWLPNISARQVFLRAQLLSLCGQAGLIVTHLSGSVGPLGTFAKQVSLFAAHNRLLQTVTYPFVVLLGFIDRIRNDWRRRSSFWLLTATKAGPEMRRPR